MNLDTDMSIELNLKNNTAGPLGNYYTASVARGNYYTTLRDKCAAELVQQLTRGGCGGLVVALRGRRLILSSSI